MLFLHQNLHYYAKRPCECKDTLIIPRMPIASQLFFNKKLSNLEASETCCPAPGAHPFIALTHLSFCGGHRKFSPRLHCPAAYGCIPGNFALLTLKTAQNRRFRRILPPPTLEYWDLGRRAPSGTCMDMQAAAAALLGRPGA